MVSVKEQFDRLRANNECALIPFITAGDPDLGATAQALQVLDSNGADLIELGVPYADPLADGPTIQAAATRSLKKGTRLRMKLGTPRRTFCQNSGPVPRPGIYSWPPCVWPDSCKSTRHSANGAAVSGL